MDLNLFGPVNLEALLDSLVVMGEGMGVILGVLIVIALIVTLLTKLTKGGSKSNKE